MMKMEQVYFEIYRVPVPPNCQGRPNADNTTTKLVTHTPKTKVINYTTVPR